LDFKKKNVKQNKVNFLGGKKPNRQKGEKGPGGGRGEDEH
jgi:hypothetical protein